jgi:predicted nuclease of predicted toxin-antitoxin system
MKFLADMGVSLSTVQALRAEKYDALHLREQNLIRLSDAEILEKATREQRVILTFDLDFGDLLATGTHSFPSVIIFRLRDETPRSVTARLQQLLAQRTPEIENGALVIVEDARLRLRRLPLEP